MYHLPVAAGSFDAVTIHQVLHYAERPLQAIEEAARVLRPGGRLFIVDFQAHALDFLRNEHEHRWLGFEEQSIAGWLKDAGLKPCESQHLEGDPLTVSIWSARRPGPRGEATAA